MTKTRKATTLLSAMGNRRSPTTRITTGVALVAMFFGSLRVGWALPARASAAAPSSSASLPPSAPPSGASRRVRPIAVEDMAGKTGADALWKLFDGDASTGLGAEGAVRVKMTFADPIAVTAVGGFAPKAGKLVLRGADGNAGGEAIDPGAGWTRVDAKKPAAARTFVVEWAPVGAGATLPELEIWGRFGAAATPQPGRALADELYGPLPDGAESFAAKAETRIISSATVPDQRVFSVTLPYDGRAIERAFLSYELDQLPHFTAATRKINGGAAVGGFAVTKGAKGGLQVEEIAPAALRAGANTIEFLPVSDHDPAGYRVGRVRLIVAHTSDAEAADDGNGPAARDEAGAWNEPSGSIRRLRFPSASQPRELRIRVSGRQPGKLVVAAGPAATRRTTSVDLNKLEAGTHAVPLDAFPAADEVTVGFEGKPGSSIRLTDLAINGSPMPAPVTAPLRITYPLHGECVNHQVHVRGLAAAQPSELRAGGAAVAKPIWERGAFSFTASEKALGGGKGEPFAFRVAATIAGRQVEATVPIDGCVDRPAAVAGADGAPKQPIVDVGAPYGVVVKAKRAAKLAFAGFELDVPAGAVEKDVRLTIRPLSPDQVPVMDATMDNITVGGRAFRLGPRGMAFKKPVRLTIPIDGGRLDPDDAPRAFYFDETDKQWHEIETIVPGRNVVVARSTHFTDFIGSTLKLPEHPGLQSLDPTSLKGIKAADPAAMVSMIAPPTANSQGTANLSYPIEIPPGRLGMQPNLAITYDSQRGNGWLGVGWDLAISTIEVDTRWGVPLYNGSERYMIDGEALVPMSQAPSGAPAGGTYYARRREGKFDWIQRVDAGGGVFHWIVTDKAGVKYTYGSVSASRLCAYDFATNAFDLVRTYKWFLETAQDVHGNQVRYGWSGVSGNNGDSWTQKYPLYVRYTAHSSNTPAYQYTVEFKQKPGAPRLDKFSTGRPGFQVLTDQLLEKVDVKNGSTIVRQYRLTYLPAKGDFGKEVLQKIEVFGKGSTPSTVSTNPIAVHTMDYWKTPVDGSNRPEIFGQPMPLGEDFPYATIQEPNYGNPARNESLRDTYGEKEGDTFNVGVAGVTVNKTISGGSGMFEDMDGDGLPDYLPFGGVSTPFAASSLGQKQSLGNFGGVLWGSMVATEFPDLYMPHGAEKNSSFTASYSFGPAIHLNGSEDHGNLTESTALHIDVNGDGLLDQVAGAQDQTLHVRLNLGKLQGFGPVINLPGYIKSGLGFDCGEVLPSGLAAAPPTGNPFPSADIITKWVAPHAGQVRITGKLTREEQGGDGMVATLYVGNTKEWAREIGPDDMLPNSIFPNLTSCTPLDASAGLDAACGGDNVGFVRTVAKGDRIYTRVNAINDAKHDGLKWDLTVQYTGTPTTETESREGWGPFRYKWSEVLDQRIIGNYYKPWVAAYSGDAHLTVVVGKTPSADDVNLKIFRFRPINQGAIPVGPGNGAPLAPGVYRYTSNRTVNPNQAGSLELDIPNVEAGDELHLWAESDTPIDPNTFITISTVGYTRLCRTSRTGVGYCGTPRCTTQANGAGSSCTIENPLGSGPSNDPLAFSPVPGSVITQIAPTYYPLNKWNYQPASPPNPPPTGLDGRKVVKAPTSSPGNNPMICYMNTVNDPNQSATFLIQSIDPQGNVTLRKKETQILHMTGDVNPCVASPSPIPAGHQVVFSVYATVPISQSFFTAKMNGAVVPLEIYTPDNSLPLRPTFPLFVGRVASMTSGYHDLYMGIFNGNAAFNEADIVGTGTPNYQPMWQRPLPKEALGEGLLAFSWNPLDWAEAAYNAVAAFGEYIWDQIVGVVKFTGSFVIRGIRWLGSIASGLFGWLICELGNYDFEAEGIQITESHSTDEGIGGHINLAKSHGFSVSALDLVDMNGDRYPDQLSTKGVRYAYFNPQTNTGNFCATRETSPTCGTGDPIVTFPGHKIRDVKHAMHSLNISGSISIADVQTENAVGNTIANSLLSYSNSQNMGQGYSHTQRDLKDINGDGLPDIVEVNTGQCTGTGYGLCVRLNYGYSFSPAIPWASPNWSTSTFELDNMFETMVPPGHQPLVDALNEVGNFLHGQDPPTNQTIRLEEQGHKGSGMGLTVFGAGQDDNYVRRVVDLVDVNGDGLPDQLMKLPGQDYKVKLNTGSGFAAETTFPAYGWPTTIDITNGWAFFRAAEADVLSMEVGKTSFDSYNAQVYASSSGPTHRGVLFDLMDIDGDGRLDQVFKNAWNLVFIAGEDHPELARVYARLNQTGKSNLLRTVNRPLGGAISLDYTRIGNSVVDGWLPWGQQIRVDMPEARWTLSGVTVTDNRGGSYSEGINVHPLGYYDRAEREFYGFAMVDIFHADSSYKRLQFDNQDYCRRGRLLADVDIGQDDRVLRATAMSFSMGSTPNATGSCFVALASTLEQQFNGKSSIFELGDPTSVFLTQPVSTPAPVAHLTTESFDSLGNLTAVRDFGDISTSADDVWQDIHYTTPSGHFTGVDRVTSRRNSDGVAFAQREATFALTGTAPLLTQVKDYIFGGNAPGTGTAYTGQATQVTAYNYTYLAADLGNPRTVTDPATYALTYDYDSTKTHVTKVTDSFTLTSSATVNMDFGLPATTTDANGKVVTYLYDVYGRLNKVWGPTDPTTGTATIEMLYSQASGTAAAVPWARTRHKDFQSTTGDTIDTVTFADGLGRIIQTKKEAELLQANGTTVAGFDISGLTVFDARGRVMAQHQPFFNSTSANTTLVPAPQKNPTMYSYDGIGRVTLTTTMGDGAVTSTPYSWVDSNATLEDSLPGFNGKLALETTIDANGHATRVYRDGTGRVVANKRYVKVSGNPTPVVTKYAYDLLGNVATVTDARENVTSATYDSLSRMVSLTSPDTGRTDWRYALTGQLGEKQTPNLRGTNPPKFIKYTYDRNRLTLIDYPTMTDVSYVYGALADAGDANGNRAGRIRTVNMEGGNDLLRYDAFGNVSQTTTTLNHLSGTSPAPAVTMKYSYDWLGRMRTMTFPRVVDNFWNVPTGDGEVITYTYDKGGMIDKISGKATPTSTAENYLNDVGYDEFGSRANVVAGNGIDTKYTYTPARHFLSTVKASGKAVSGTVQFANYTYGYDLVGNILSISNSPPQSALQAPLTLVGVGPIQITNTYDDLDRLLTSTGKYRGHTTFGHSYSSTFSYDLIDNITSKNQSDTKLTFNASDQGLQGGTPVGPVVPTTYSLTYNYPFGSPPHQPATINDTNAGSTQTRTERFDLNGNNTGDTIGTTTRTLVWDEADRLKSVTQGTTTQGAFRYDPGGERTQKQAPSNGTTTFYFNQFLAINGSKQMTKHLFAGETRIASKTESAQLTTPVRNFYHPDHIGSTSYVSDAAQNLVQHERYFPFGERWWEFGNDEFTTTNNIKRDHLFTGKDLDRDTGFYYFGARYLDPRTSIWLSTDPILDSYMKGAPSGGVLNPKNLALYSYSWNNPVTLRDPDGLQVKPPDLIAKEAIVDKVKQVVHEAACIYGCTEGPKVQYDPKTGKYTFTRDGQVGQTSGPIEGKSGTNPTGTPDGTAVGDAAVIKTSSSPALRRDLVGGPHAADTPIGEVIDRAAHGKKNKVPQSRWNSPEAADAAARSAVGATKPGSVPIKPGDGFVIVRLPGGGVWIREADRAAAIPGRKIHTFPIGPEHPLYRIRIR
jgi:RHS repeat-associated protein